MPFALKKPADEAGAAWYVILEQSTLEVKADDGIGRPSQLACL